MNTTGVMVLLAVLTVASGYAVWWNRRSGQVAAVTQETAPALPRLVELVGDTPVTLIQFSAEVCSQCAATRRLLTRLASSHPGLSHIEVDVVDELETIRALDIRRTPTTLIVTKSGSVAYRVSGVPREADLMAAISDALAAR